MKQLHELLEKGYASKVPDAEMKIDDGKAWYLPHHSVMHQNKQDKVRNIVDCAAKYNNISLNDKIHQGPDITNSLVGVLCRLRNEPIALMVEIEEIFHQSL